MTLTNEEGQAGTLARRYNRAANVTFVLATACVLAGFVIDVGTSRTLIWILAAAAASAATLVLGAKLKRVAR